MNIKNILTQFEKKQAAANAAREAELERDRQSRLHNAEAVEARIRELIEPVFNECRDQITKGGYPCEVVLEEKADSKYPASKKVCAIGIRLGTNREKGGNVRAIYLKYLGGYDGQGIIRESKISDIKESGPLALENFTQTFVEDDVESFLRDVFAV